MLANVVDTACDVAATLCLKLEVLEAFHRCATREGLRCSAAQRSAARRLAGTGGSDAECMWGRTVPVGALIPGGWDACCVLCRRKRIEAKMSEWHSQFVGEINQASLASRGSAACQAGLSSPCACIASAQQWYPGPCWCVGAECR